MKTNFLPKFILLSVLSLLIYSCTSEDVVIPQKKTSTTLRVNDSIGEPKSTGPKG